MIQMCRIGDCRNWVTGLSMAMGLFVWSVSQDVRADTPPDVDWSRSFTPERMTAYVEPGASRFVVIPAAANPIAGRVALVVQQSLLATGKAQQVLDGEALNLAGEGSDQAMVLRAAQLPIDRVVVVRSLSVPSTQVIVNIYDRQGLRLVALQASPNEIAIPFREMMFDNEIDNIKASRTLTALDLAKTEYADRHLGFFGVGPAEGRVQSTNLRLLNAYEGEKHRPLAPPDLYLRFGRPELIVAYEKRRKDALLLIYVGSGLFGVGVLGLGLMFGGYAVDKNDYMNLNLSNPTLGKTGAQMREAGGALLAIGGILGAVSFGFGYAWYRERQPIPSDEVLRLANEYNRALKRRLGLSASVLPLLRSIKPEFALTPQYAMFGGRIRF